MLLTHENLLMKHMNSAEIAQLLKKEINRKWHKQKVTYNAKKMSNVVLILLWEEKNLLTSFKTSEAMAVMDFTKCKDCHYKIFSYLIFLEKQMLRHRLFCMIDGVLWFFI